MIEDDLNVEVKLDTNVENLENLDLLELDFEEKRPDHSSISKDTMETLATYSPTQQKKAIDALKDEELSKPTSLKDQLMDTVVNPKKKLNYALGVISTDYWSQYFDVTDIQIKDRLIAS